MLIIELTRVMPVNTTSPIWFVCPFKFEYLDDWAIVACTSEVKIISTNNNVEKLHATKARQSKQNADLVRGLIMMFFSV